MSIRQFLSELRRDGVQIWLEDDQLRYSAPKGVMQPQRLVELRANRQAILELLKRASAQQAAPVVPCDRNRLLPLSYMQERLWLLQERERDQSYTVAGALAFKGPLAEAALQAALDDLIARHELLRTRFDIVVGGDTPSQLIDPPALARLVQRDIAPEGVAEAIRQLADAPFDLRRAPMLRVQLLQLSPDDHVLVIVLHLIVADGWSIGVLTRDLRELYAAHAGQRIADLPPLAIQYADYACWQRGQDLREHLDYWTRRLAGYSQPLDLAVVGGLQATERGPVRVLRRTVDATLSNRLARFGRERQASLFTVLLAGLALAAHRQTGQTDLCLGTTSSGRDDPALEPLIGFFTNILPVRIDLAGDPSGEEAFERVSTAMLDALDHKAVPFEHILAALPGHHQNGGRALVPVMVRHQNYPDTEAGPWAGGLQVRPLTTDAPRPATSDLDLQYYGDAGTLRVVAEFDTVRLDQAGVEALLSTMERLLEQLAAQPEARLSALLAPNEDERARLAQWNATDRAFEPATLAELFVRQLRQGPDALACRCGDVAVSYAELDRLSGNVARALAGQGAGPGARVVLHHPRGIEFLAGLLGIIRAGCIYVAVDPSYPAAYVDRILDDAEPAVVLLQPGLHDGPSPRGARMLPLDASVLDAGGAAPPWAEAEPDDPAYIAYTSGSTGRPKGVLVQHRQVLNCLQSLWASMPYAADEMVAQKTSPVFVPSVKELLAPLLAGMAQVVLSDLLVRDTPSFAAALQQSRVTRLYLVPSHLDALLEHAALLGSLRDVVTAGEPLPQALRRRFELLLPGARLHNNYGCSELHDITYCSPGDQETAGHTVPIGRPIANTRLHVLDDKGRPVAPGVAGMLHVEGASVGPGYWRQPNLTAQRFSPGPGGRPGVRMFRTGDLARWLPDGRLECLGRDDLQIKVRGQSVDAAQVEFELSGHPAVSRAAVALGTGQHEGVLVAHVVPAAGTVLDGAALHDWLQVRLPGHMVPSLFAPHVALPALPNGKLDRLSLRRMPLDGLPAGAAARTPPRTTLERSVAAIWAELLEMPVEQVCLEDNFFALGGHSLMATRAAARLRHGLGVDLPLRTLFSARTLGALAAELADLPQVDDQMDQPAAATRQPARATAPLSRGQQMVWESRAYKDTDHGNDVWNLAWLALIEGDVQVPALQAAFEVLLDRHDILSHVFREVEGRMVQRKNPQRPAFQLWVVHAAEAGIHDAASLQALLRQDRRKGFDWSRDPLLIRALLVVQGDNTHVLQFTIHHMAADAWSLAISVAELGAIYQAILHGEEHGLPPLPIQFIDYVHWERAAAPDDMLARQRQFWLDRLRDAPQMTGLPLDRPRPGRPLGWAERVAARLSPALNEGIRRLAQQHEGTPFALMLAALNLLVWDRTGQTDQVVILPTAIRERPEFEPMIGPLVNAVAVRNQVDPLLSFVELGARVKATMMLTYENRHMPINRIIDELIPQGTPGVPPLSQILFGVVNIPDMDLSLPGIKLTPMPPDARTAWFDTRINVFERPDGFVVEWDYATDLFDRSSAQGFLDGYVAWIEAGVAEPMVPLGELAERVAARRR